MQGHAIKGPAIRADLVYSLKGAKADQKWVNTRKKSADRTNRSEDDLISFKPQPLFQNDRLASPIKLVGTIQLESVKFIYPDRP